MHLVIAKVSSFIAHSFQFIRNGDFYPIFVEHDIFPNFSAPNRLAVIFEVHFRQKPCPRASDLTSPKLKMTRIWGFFGWAIGPRKMSHKFT